MSKDKISDYSATANSNTDIAGINIDEGCAPSGINNAIRTLMAQLKNFQTGASGDDVTVGGVLTVKGASINDTNGNELFKLTATSSAVNELTVANAATGSSPTLSATGGDTNIGINLVAKGTGGIVFPAGAVATPAITTTGDLNTGVYFPAADTVGVTTGGTERVRVDSSGNVGIGTSSPSNAKLNSIGADTAPQLNLYSSSSGSLGANFTYKTSSGDLYMATNGYNSSSAPQMVLSASGNLLVGGTSQVLSSRQLLNFDGGVYNALVVNDTTSNTNRAYAYFSIGGVLKGSITGTTSSTSYNTSSDYRLKENIAPMTGALSVVQQLKPCTYNWKIDGSAGQGFIAHELAEVVPDCVTGEKDATEIEQYEISPAVPATFDEEGNELTPAVEAVMGEREVPVYQGIDTSFLVATLTAAIQELKAVVDAQAARIEALEAK